MMKINKPNMEMKYGFKGTDKNMKCRDTQFEIGKTYYIDDEDKVQELPENYTVIKNKVKLCSKEALHYCNELVDVFKHYTDNGNNRFFKVEIIGAFEDSADKSGTRCIKFIEEISREYLDKQKQLKKELEIESSMYLELVRNLQKIYPNLIIGGSISLYLQGTRLKRFGHGHDLDLIFPYWQLIENTEGVEVDESDEERFSGSDYQNSITINGIKADIRIDPEQKYEIITYKDHQYKVVPMIDIIEAKVRYALKKSGEKHLNDLKELILR